MSSLGDLLLYAISSLQKMSWGSYCKAFNELHPRGLRLADGSEDMPDRHDRRRAAIMLDVLGHVDLDFVGREGTLTVSPATLFQLPTRGLPRAILAGRRSPQTITDLVGASDGLATTVYARAQPERSVFAPARIEIVSESNESLLEFADRIGVACDLTPAAWTITTFAGSLGEYLAQLTWERRGELNWPRSDFSIETLRFERGLEADGETVLSRYDDPTQGGQYYMLRNGPLSAEVDPSWGRYAVLASGRTVLEYSEETGQVIVPATVPLPRLFSRALSACSGLAPVLTKRASEQTGLVEAYDAVSRNVIGVCADKLGQRPPWEGD